MMKAIRGATKKSYSAMANSINKEAIHINEITSVLEKWLKPYATKHFVKDIELKLTKSMAASESRMVWKFLYAVGGSAVLIAGVGGYAFEKLDKKIDKLDSKIDQILARLPK